MIHVLGYSITTTGSSMTSTPPPLGLRFVRGYRWDLKEMVPGDALSRYPWASIGKTQNASALTGHHSRQLWQQGEAKSSSSATGQMHQFFLPRAIIAHLLYNTVYHALLLFGSCYLKSDLRTAVLKKSNFDEIAFYYCQVPPYGTHY